LILKDLNERAGRGKRMIEKFQAYARAFDQTVADDDWGRLEQFFTPDAVYLPGDGREIHGREAVLAHFRDSLDTFDRRFDSRRLEPTGQPVVEGTVLTIPWKATYEKDGLPDVVISGTESATFSGSAISRLEDTLDEGSLAEFETWTSAFGGSLSGDSDR
jgi:hypothetical protein